MSKAPPVGRMVAGLLSSVLYMAILSVVGVTVMVMTNSVNLTFFAIPLVGGSMCGLISNWTDSTTLSIGWVLSFLAWALAGLTLLLTTTEFFGGWLRAAPVAVPMYAGGYFFARWMLNHSRTK